MVQVAARAAVVVAGVARIVIAGGAFIGIDAIPAIGAGAGRAAVIMDIVVDDPVAAGPDRDAAQRAIADSNPSTTL